MSHFIATVGQHRPCIKVTLRHGALRHSAYRSSEMGVENDVTTHSAYKAGTDRLARWLIRNARICGIEREYSLSSTAPIRTSSSKHPRRLREHQKYRISPKEFIRLAKGIAASTHPTIRLPETLALVIRETIHMRNQTSDLYLDDAKRSKSKAAMSPNDGHRHFTAVLENVLSILEAQSTKQSTQTNTSSFIRSRDIITALELDGRRYQNSEDTKLTVQIEHSQGESDFDKIFCIHTFFKDMNAIREFISPLWEKYACGELDLMSVSVTTDLAFTLMKHTSEEIAALVPEAASWSAMVFIMTEAFDGLSNQKGFLNETCAQTATTLNDFIRILEPNSLVQKKTGHLGEYDPTQDRLCLSDDEKYREDVIILTELMTEVVTLARLDLEVPGQDELTSGLRDAINAGSDSIVPTFVIFAAQLLLDIHHVLRSNASWPLETLQATGKRSMVTLDQHFKYFSGRRNPDWPDENDDFLQSMKTYAEEWTQSDYIATTFTKAATVPVNPRPFHFLRRHPVLCGLKTFRLNILLQDSGIKLCNTWGSVIFQTHLYNATSCSAALNARWRDLDYLISVHSPRRIFAGAPPTDLREYSKRFALVLGRHANNDFVTGTAGLSHSLGGSRTRTAPRTLKTTSPVKDIFRPRYVDGGIANLNSQNIVAMLSVATKLERTSRPLVNLPDFSKDMKAQSEYSAIQLLQIVLEGVAAEELHLLFDYFGLNQRGCSLLFSLKTQLEPDMEKHSVGKPNDEGPQLPVIVEYIFGAANGSKDLSQDLDPACSTSRILHQAADILREFLKDDGFGGSGARSIMCARALTNAVVAAYHAKTCSSIDQ